MYRKCLIWGAFQYLFTVGVTPVLKWKSNVMWLKKAYYWFIQRLLPYGNTVPDMVKVNFLRHYVSVHFNVTGWICLLNHIQHRINNYEWKMRVKPTWFLWKLKIMSLPLYYLKLNNQITKTLFRMST